MDYDEIADAVLQKNRAGEQVKKILAPPPVFYSIQSRIYSQFTCRFAQI